MSVTKYDQKRLTLTQVALEQLTLANLEKTERAFLSAKQRARESNEEHTKAERAVQAAEKELSIVQRAVEDAELDTISAEREVILLDKTKINAHVSRSYQTAVKNSSKANHNLTVKMQQYDTAEQACNLARKTQEKARSALTQLQQDATSTKKAYEAAISEHNEALSNVGNAAFLTVSSFLHKLALLQCTDLERQAMKNILLDNGFDIDRYPKMLSNDIVPKLIRKGSCDAVRKLIDHKFIAPGAVGNFGCPNQTLFRSACEFGRLEIAHLLLTKGALEITRDFNKPLKTDDSLFSVVNLETTIKPAQQKQYQEFITLLAQSLRNCQDPNVFLGATIGDKGFGLVHWCARYQNKVFLKTLMEFNVDIHKTITFATMGFTVTGRNFQNNSKSGTPVNMFHAAFCSIFVSPQKGEAKYNRMAKVEQYMLYLLTLGVRLTKDVMSLEEVREAIGTPEFDFAIKIKEFIERFNKAHQKVIEASRLTATGTAATANGSITFGFNASAPAKGDSQKEMPAASATGLIRSRL